MAESYHWPIQRPNPFGKSWCNRASATCCRTGGHRYQETKVVNDWTYDRPLLATRISPTGLIAVTSSEDYQLQRWDLATGGRIVFKGHESWVHALQFSPDGNELVSGGCEGTLAWWSILDAEPKPKRTVAAHQGWIRAMDRSPDGKLIASVGNDAMVRVWAMDSGKR